MNLLSDYLQEKRELSRNRAMLFVFFAIPLVPLFSGFDYLFSGSNFHYFLKLRIFDTLKNLIIFSIFYFHKNISLNAINWLTSFYACSLALMISYMCRVLGGYESSYYSGLILILLAMGLLMPWRASYTILNSLFIYAIYVIVARTPQTSWYSLINNSYFLLSIIWMGSISTYYAEKGRLRDYNNRQELKKRNLQLQELDETKTRFFTNLTHEFRTPLVANSTLLQAIKEEVPLTPNLKRLLDNATISLEQILENVNDLLTQTSSEKGFLEMFWTRIEIIEFAKNNLELFRMLAKKQGAELVFANNLRTPALEIYADRSKLKKILNNLIGNAIKFTRGGIIQLRLSADQGFLQIEVEDNGLGIPAEDLVDIFKPFTQASNNPLRDVRGTGLGLSIVHDFVIAHHGTIDVKSQLGAGTLFKILLPLGDQHIDKTKLDYTEVIVEAPSSSERIVAFHADEDPKLKSYANQHPDAFNLAIIEDNSHVTQSLAYMLQGEYNLHFARDGEAGLELIRRVKPDLVLTDIMMPKMNGYELLTSIKQDPELKEIPVIFLTAKVDLESKIQGLTEGADEYLGKPFNMIEVRTRIRNLLSHKKLEAECICNVR